ncbi:RNA polymerase sigma factor, partial [Undibacterium sp.]|uniref:RNA polymerase sigma factor n=1 Tax=Undibacterium sp. TaxID=1914977 RepID=UPI00374C8A34
QEKSVSLYADVPTSGRPAMPVSTKPPESAQLEALLSRISLYDLSAFRLLHDAVAPKLLALAWRIVGRRELAEEAVQEGFIAIWRRAGSYRAGRATPMSWLVAIVRNKAIDILRGAGKTRWQDLPDMAEDYCASVHAAPAASADEKIQAGSDAQSLLLCLSTLKDTQRQAIQLAYFGNMPYREIAQRMELPLGTVKTWIRRGLLKMRLQLQQGDDV